MPRESDLDRLREAAKRQRSRRPSTGFDMDRVRRERARIASDIDRLRRASAGQSRPRNGVPLATGKPIEWKVAGAPTGGEGGGGRSLLQQFTALPAEIATGVIGAAPDIAKTAYSPVTNVGAVVASGLGVESSDLDDNFLTRNLLVNQDLLRAREQGEGFGGMFKAAAPFLGDLASDAHRTGGDLVDLASVPLGDQGWDESAYGKASKEGRIVGQVIGDVGNLALSGSVAARAAGRGAKVARGARKPGSAPGKVETRLTDVARRIEKFDDELAKTAMVAPKLLPLAKKAGQKALSTERGQALLARARDGAVLPAARARLLTPSTAPVREIMARWDRVNAVRRQDEALGPAQLVRDILTGEGRVQRTGARVLGREPGTPKRDPGTVKAAEGAMFLDMLDARTAFAPLDPIRQADPAAFRGFVDKLAEQYDNPTLTPEAVGTYLDKINDRLDPVLAADMDRAKALWVERANAGGLERDVAGARVVTGADRNLVEGTGRFDKDAPGRREAAELNLGNRLLPFETQRVTEARDAARKRLEGTLRRAGASSPRLAKALERFDGQTVAKLDEALKRIESAPARWRPTIDMGRMVKSLVDDFDWETYNVPGELLGKLAGEVVTTVEGVMSQTQPSFLRGSLPGAGGTGGVKGKKLSSQHLKLTGQVPLDAAAQAALAANDIRRQATNEALMEVLDKVGVKASDNPAWQGLEGGALLDAVSEAMGDTYVGWDPRKILDTDRTGRTIKSRAAAAKSLDPSAETTLVPEYVADAFDYAMSEQSKLAQALIDRPTRVFKGSVLALSPRWLAGNVVSGAVQLHAGDVTVKDIIRYSKQAKQAIGDYKAGRRSDVPREIFGSGYAAQERRLLDGLADTMENIDFDEMTVKRSKNRLVRGTGTLVRKGYDLNTVVDDWYRSIAYLKKLDEVDATTGKAKYTEQQAVKEALDIVGDYDRMTPFEKRVIRRALPFYAWIRHITKLTAKVATEDPARMMWNIHLATLYAPEDMDYTAVPWLGSAVKVGDDYLNISWLFPFATSAEIDYSNPARFLGSNLNPVVGTGLAAAFGVDSSFGDFSPLSRPDAEYGQNPGGPLWPALTGDLGALGQTAYLVGRNLPQFKGAYDEVQRRRSGGTPPRLYDTGERMKGINQNAELEDNLARFIGVPIPKSYDVDGILKRQRG